MYGITLIDTAMTTQEPLLMITVEDLGETILYLGNIILSLFVIILAVLISIFGITCFRPNGRGSYIAEGGNGCIVFFIGWLLFFSPFKSLIIYSWQSLQNIPTHYLIGK
jgi:hypothetical protein